MRPMPMRYRRLSARFLRPHAAPRAVHPDHGWDVAFLALSAPAWRPAVDTCETADAFLVVVEVAGIDEDRTEVTLFADGLVVEGERAVELCAVDGRYERAEIRQGPFRVELGLPYPIEPERVEATYDRGLLRITLPRLAPISVDVQARTEGIPDGDPGGGGDDAPAPHGERAPDTPRGEPA
jgi:HSP20 family protein